MAPSLIYLIHRLPTSTVKVRLPILVCTLHMDALNDNTKTKWFLGVGDVIFVAYVNVVDKYLHIIHYFHDDPFEDIRDP